LDAEITNLKAWSAGDPAALERLSKQVYDELRRMARRHMKGERRDNTLQTTALVAEGFPCFTLFEVEPSLERWRATPRGREFLVNSRREWEATP
jgi:hypothetical protein